MRSRENNGPFNIFIEEQVNVEFFDLDSMRVVWHGNYFNYFEIGRRVLLEKIGYNYDDMEEAGFIFPVVEAKVKYLGPLRFLDIAKIKAVLMEYENCLRISYEVRNAQTGALCTKAVTTQMAYNFKANESYYVCPRDLIEKVEALISQQGARSRKQ
jgi:acyl-CoA thioester hydrolase